MSSLSSDKAIGTRSRSKRKEVEENTISRPNKKLCECEKLSKEKENDLKIIEQLKADIDSTKAEIRDLNAKHSELVELLHESAQDQIKKIKSEHVDEKAKLEDLHKEMIEKMKVEMKTIETNAEVEKLRAENARKIDDQKWNATQRALKDTSETVTLDVGGRIFKTSRSVLCRYPNTFFTAMFSKNFRVKKNHLGHIEIDRCGVIFEVILNFLRTGKTELDYPLEDNALTLFSQSDILEEAKYFCLEDKMFSLCENKEVEMITFCRSKNYVNPYWKQFGTTPIKEHVTLLWQFRTCVDKPTFGFEIYGQGSRRETIEFVVNTNTLNLLGTALRCEMTKLAQKEAFIIHFNPKEGECLYHVRNEENFRFFFPPGLLWRPFVSCREDPGTSLMVLDRKQGCSCELASKN